MKKEREESRVAERVKGGVWLAVNLSKSWLTFVVGAYLAQAWQGAALSGGGGDRVEVAQEGRVWIPSYLRWLCRASAQSPPCQRSAQGASRPPSLTPPCPQSQIHPLQHARSLPRERAHRPRPVDGPSSGCSSSGSGW